MPKQPEKTLLHVEITKELLARFTEMAKKQGVSRSTLARQMISKWTLRKEKELKNK